MSGKMIVYVGCMYSGKSKSLIKELRNSGPSVTAFKPVIDSRYAEGEIASHDGDLFPANQVDTGVSGLEDILSKSRQYDVIGIDECQFFDFGLLGICDYLVSKGKTLLCAGLDLDYKGRPFGPMPGLMALAEKVHKIAGECSCGAPATRTWKRQVSEGKLIEVGSHDLYEARCRKCWERPRES
jgi:thymidine kinase